MHSLKILCPNGHLGFAPLRVESFLLGVAEHPDYIAADSGSDDIGPVPLGADSSASPHQWQSEDLEHMLLASRKLGVPMIIGSSGDTGTNSQVDRFVAIIKKLAAKHSLKPFKLGYFYSEIDKEYVRKQMRTGNEIRGLDGRHSLTEDELDRTERIVAMAGVHPFIDLLEKGADVIIGGRSSDSAIFASASIHHGFSESDSYYLGKVLECASFCAEPYGGKESVMGEVMQGKVQVTAMHPGQSCTVASVSGHAMYERSDPFSEYVAGGMLDMSNCKYEQISAKTTEVTGQKFIPATEFRVKLEGSGKVGNRFVGIVGIRDPYTIKNVDKVIAWARDQVVSRFGHDGYELYFNVFGKNGVMGDLEPLKDVVSHELCILVQSVAPTPELAEEICVIGMRQMFYARLDDVKGTAGSVAFPLDEPLRASDAYLWTLNHTMRAKDGLELFPRHIIEIGK